MCTNRTRSQIDPINDQFRICCVWTEAGAEEVEIVDYTDLLLIPPGEVLLEEFPRPMGISQYRLAQSIDVQESRINAIVKGRRAITADTDLRLCRLFSLSEGFWLRMLASPDLKRAKQALESVLPTIHPVGRSPI